MDKINRYVDENKKTCIEQLAHIISFKNVSTWLQTPETQQAMEDSIEYVLKKLKNFGAEVELADAGMKQCYDGSEVPLPRIILATLGRDPEKKTICMYGHLDVQPALKSDGWDTEPFELTEVENKLYGRGTTDDKGPVMCMLLAVEAYRGVGLEIPVNLKFIFESMEESDSEGLEEVLKSRKDTFLKDCDYVCISDNNWIGSTTPCLTYGLRGACHFMVDVRCAQVDLHSGAYGGVVHEAMTDLLHILSRLIDQTGKIIIPGIHDEVLPLTDKEAQLYDSLNFSTEEYRRDIDHKELRYKTKQGVLMHLWRYPSLSVHGIEGAYSDQGEKTVIPNQVIGKFSIRTVPNMTASKLEHRVVEYIKALQAQSGSPNEVKVSMSSSGEYWVGDPNHPHFQAGARAVESVYGIKPDMTREGGSVPIAVILQRVTQKNVMLLPVGAFDDGAHSQNEKLDIKNYICGIKLMAAYFSEVAALDY